MVILKAEILNILILVCFIITLVMEEDDEAAINNFKRLIGDLIDTVRKMSKNPEVNDDLGKTLDTFMSALEVTQQYLTNGIVNVGFAEAALFIQSCVELYEKKVDLLFHTIMEYQMQLCSYQKVEEAADEIATLVQRMFKKGKRKTVLREPPVSHSAEHIVGMYKNSYKAAESTTNVEVCTELMESWNGLFNANASQAEISEPTRRSAGYDSEVFMHSEPQCNYEVFDLRSTEMLSTYDDFLTNNIRFSVNLCHNAVPVVRNDTDSVDSDSVQGDVEPFNDEELRNSCLCKSTVVNITRLPQNLMDSFKECNDSLMLDLTRQFLSSGVTTVFKSPELNNNTEDRGYESGISLQTYGGDIQSCSIRKSNDDSGIFCSLLSNNTVMEVEETDHNHPCTIPEGSAIPKSENVASTLNVPEQSIQVTHNLDIGAFVPLTSSTPKSRIAVVKLERLSRKRLLPFENKSKSKPKRAAMGRFKWLKTISTTYRTFEKFHNLNYVPASDEGIVLPWMENDSSDDSDVPEMEVEPADEIDVENENAEFCTSIILGIVNNVVDSKTKQAATEPKSATNKSAFETPPASLQKLHVMNNWRDFIQPIVDQAESRSKFNIHEYGTTLMDAIPENKNLSFKDLVAGQPAHEVARFFLATLQLTNTNNVELVNTCAGQLANDTLEMKLLTRDRYHEHLEEYEAPSEHSFKEKLARVHAIRQSSAFLNMPSTSRNPPPMALLQPLLQQNKRNYSKRQRLG